MNEATTAALDVLAGEGKTPTGFEQIDMNFNLRMRAYIGICMPPMFAHMEKRFSMMQLRRDGIAPVLFYVDFRNTNAPLAFARSLLTRHELRLRRSRDARGDRLMLDSTTTIEGRRQAGGRDSLGYDPQAGELVAAGSAHVLHVLTRPAAPAAERRVEAVPEPLQGLCEHAWEESLPDAESVREVPAGFEKVAGDELCDYQDVWGLPNTDINQHVNVLEYLMGLENQTTRLLHAAALPVTAHRITRCRVLFRKPFFPGQRYRMQARLYCRERETFVRAAFHGVDEAGRIDQRPHVAASINGVLVESDA